MSLSCDCGYDEYEYYMEFYEGPYWANSVGSCYGCKKPINIGDEVSLIAKYEYDEDGDEINHEVYGRICETCLDMYYNLTELGYCITDDGAGFIEQCMDEYKRLQADRLEWIRGKNNAKT